MGVKLVKKMIINVQTRKTLNVFLNCSLLLYLLRFIVSKMSRLSILVSWVALFTAPPILNSSLGHRGPPKHKRQSTLNNSSKSRIKIEGKRTNSSSSIPKHSRNRKEDIKRLWEEEKEIEHSSIINNVVFSPDRGYLASGSGQYNWSVDSLIAI